MKTTIRKIAQMAGVSRGTVDRVLNGRPGVKPQIRENVMRIARELDYVPNMAAKALAYNKKPIILGVVMPSTEIAFFDEIRKGIDTAVDEMHNMGVRVEFRHMDSRDASSAAAALEGLLELGVSGIMVSAMDDAAIRAKINEAAERKIPVITFNSDVTDCRRLCFVGQNLYKSGRVAAGLMSKVIPGGAEIIVVTGSMAFHAHKERVNGFTDTLAGVGGGFRVAEVIEGFDRYDDTYRKLSEALGRHKQIRGIYMATGHVGACMDAITEKGLTGKVHIICNDILPEIVDNMKKGLIDFTIVQDPFSQGYKPLNLLREYIFLGREPKAEHIYTEISIKIPENL